MATSAYASTQETTNFNRTSRLLFGPCSEQLRDLLRYHVPPINFTQVIKQSRRNLPRLTQVQRDIILPNTGHYSSDYSDFDISLLYLLLRNICNIPPHTNGWGNSPDVSDNSLAANIDRIREARNRVGHSTSVSLSQTDFNDVWAYIKGAVQFIDTFLQNGKKYEKDMDFLKSETMDPEQEQFYVDQIRKQAKEDTGTREALSNLEKHVKEKGVNFEAQIKRTDILTQSLELQIHSHDKQTKALEKQFQEMEEKSERLESDFDRHEEEIQQIKHQLQPPQVTVDDQEIERLKNRLFQINYTESKKISLSPLRVGGHKLPLEQLFSSVIIKGESNKKIESPNDIFFKDGHVVRRIFMLGDAAHGKTTYCKWLLKHWCQTEKSKETSLTLNEWEKHISEYDFVFHIPLRHVDSSRVHVTEMIWQDILWTDSGLKEAVKFVLSSANYRCFIIIDGLDEWKPNKSSVDQLKYKGMPNIDNMSNCVIFITMRPWKFADVEEIIRDDDRIVEIKGLDEKGIIMVIENVLVHYYGMEPRTNAFKTKHTEIIRKLQDATFKSFIHIPLLAVACVQIWYKGEQVRDSLTSFYLALVNMLIERSNHKLETQDLGDQTLYLSLQQALSKHKSIKRHIDVFYKLGKVAYRGLLSKQLKLEFLLDDLENEIGEKNLQFALDVGLISQRDAPSVMTRKVSVHFLHKSVQELLAAMYIVTQDDSKDSFCVHLSNVGDIMELSNVIMFICCMCPSLGDVIVQKIIHIIDADIMICKCRNSLVGINKVDSLFNLQLKWHTELELEYGRENCPMTCYVSDVYLSPGIDNEKDRNQITKEILAGQHNYIRSLILWDVTEKISNAELNSFLSNTNLTCFLNMICIYGGGNQTQNLDTRRPSKRSVPSFCIPSLKTLRLFYVEIDETDATIPLLSNMPLLERLRLDDIILGERSIGLTPAMTAIQRVTLRLVKMTPLGWQQFLESLINIEHSFHVVLIETNIDEDSVTKIRTSNHFSMKNITWFGRFVFRAWYEFTKEHSEFRLIPLRRSNGRHALASY